MFQCQKCPKRFKSQEGLESHRKAVHTKICDICASQFGSDQRYSDHQYLLHRYGVHRDLYAGEWIVGRLGEHLGQLVDAVCDRLPPEVCPDKGKGVVVGGVPVDLDQWEYTTEEGYDLWCKAFADTQCRTFPAGEGDMVDLWGFLHDLSTAFLHRLPIGSAVVDDGRGETYTHHAWVRSKPYSNQPDTTEKGYRIGSSRYALCFGTGTLATILPIQVAGVPINMKELGNLHYKRAQRLDAEKKLAREVAQAAEMRARKERWVRDLQLEGHTVNPNSSYQQIKKQWKRMEGTKKSAQARKAQLERNLSHWTTALGKAGVSPSPTASYEQIKQLWRKHCKT